MSVKVKNGTPVNGPSLCETCTRAHFVKGYRESEVSVVCQAIYPERRVTFAVSECSSYVNKIRNTLIEMERIAWTLAPRGPKRKAGFVAPHGPDGREREIQLVLDDKA